MGFNRFPALRLVSAGEPGTGTGTVPGTTINTDIDTGTGTCTGTYTVTDADTQTQASEHTRSFKACVLIIFQSGGWCHEVD